MQPEVLWLQELEEKQQWDEIIKVAQQLLLQQGRYTISELAWINYALCRANLWRNHLEEACLSGEMARALAKKSECWDTLGFALASLGVVYAKQHRYELAQQRLYEYHTYRADYGKALSVDGNVWFTIGRIHQYSGQYEDAVRYFQKARPAYERVGNRLWAFMSQHATVRCLLDVAPHKAPPLLIAARAALRHIKDNTAWVAYLTDRALYAYHQGRYVSSMYLATRALDRASLATERFHAYMVLYRCSTATKDIKNALGWALAARITALRDGSHGLAFLATEAIHDLVLTHGQGPAAELDRDYLSMGIDMTSFVGDSVLKERGNVR